MNEINEKVARLEAFARAGREHFDRTRGLDPNYVSAVVMPTLADVMGDIRAQIEQFHKLSELQGEQTSVIHYTSVGTVVSMLQDIVARKGSSLRLYDSDHFNDPVEGLHLANYLDLPVKRGWPNWRETTHAYIASFIPDLEGKDMQDNLVLWRTYGKEGEGCSLRFSVPRDKLWKILYGDKGVEPTANTLAPVLDALQPLMDGLRYAGHYDVRERLAQAFWRRLEGIRFLYKDPAYTDEDERRFVVPERDIKDKDGIQFEFQNSNIPHTNVRHYCEDEALNVKRILVSGSLITLGPRVPYAQSMRYYLENLLRKADLLPGPQVTVSRIPYRVP